MKHISSIRNAAVQRIKICEVSDFNGIMVIYLWEWYEYGYEIEATEGACYEALC